MILRMLVVALVAAACSSADASSPSGSCADLNVCVGGDGASDPRAIPGDPSAVVASGNTALCSLVLTATGGSIAGGGPGCGGSEGDGPPTTPTATGICKELFDCCSSITEAGGAAACNVVALEDYSGDVVSVPPGVDACTPAIEYFQGEGFCTSIHLGSGK